MIPTIYTVSKACPCQTPMDNTPTCSGIRTRSTAEQDHGSNYLNLGLGHHPVFGR